MDVEGAEYEIFDSMSIETAEKIRKISLEYHAWEGKDIQHLIRRLEGLGFHLTFHPEDEKHKVGMILASRTQSQ
jgi:ribosomal protein S15P/S13E